MTKREIVFENGRRAVVVVATANARGPELLSTLGLTRPAAVLLVFGGAGRLDESQRARLEELFRDAIAPAGAETAALVIDGGTQSGVMKMIGEAAVARSPNESRLLGVSPAGKVRYPGASDQEIDRVPLEPNHSHFVLVESDEWGGETDMIFELARSCETRTVAILVNGGPIAVNEALQTVRNGWPLMVLDGSGRAADDVSAAIRQPNLPGREPLGEIARSGCVTLFHIDAPVANLRDGLCGALAGPSMPASDG